MAGIDENKANHGPADPIVPIDFSPNEEQTRRFSFRFRWLHVFVAAFALVSIIAGWFVLTAKSVSIEVTPITAEIGIEGGLNFRLGQRYLIRSGSYRISLTNEGYHDSVTQLLVGTEQSQTHQFEMRKLPGRVTVTTADPTPARVRIDGVDVGTTPLTDLPVEAGEHSLVITRDRFLDHSETINIEGRSVEQSFSVELSPAWAEISFSTSPAGAQVLVDGDLVGVTPLDAEVLQGRHEVTLKLAGHKAWQDDLDVIAGAGFAVPMVALEPADGLVFLQTNPTQVSVTVNGQFQGLTPLEVALPPGQDHELSFFKNGYHSSRSSIRTEPDQERELTITLNPVMASVDVVAEPPDAELYVNGEFRGSANQTIELMAASQQIEIRKDGFVPYTTDFTSRPGLDQQIRVTLKSLEQARLEQIEPVITSPAGQQLKLFYPTAFTMGASRREPGRRPNETLREIQLERPFYLAAREVSNAEYRLFDSEHSSGTVQGLTLNNEAQPVVRVTWTQAARYCNWLSEQEGLPLFYLMDGEEVVGFNPEATGYRLPTEAEWAWVARTDASGATLRYPWGESLPPPENSGNFADVTVQQYLGQVLFDYDDGYFATAPVGSYQSNQHEIYDLAGNVAEWVHDFYGSSAGAFGAVEVDPLGPLDGQFHTLRGSSWAHGSITELRLSFRDFGSEPRDDVGFRVARYLEE
mgnify:CR=1 FL=1